LKDKGLNYSLCEEFMEVLHKVWVAFRDLAVQMSLVESIENSEAYLFELRKSRISLGTIYPNIEQFLDEYHPVMYI
jgi:translation initiation factor 2B subunit (eIF-2B alpha/beta/delta family)